MIERAFYGFMRLCYLALLFVCVYGSFAVSDWWAILGFFCLGAFCWFSVWECRP